MTRVLRRRGDHLPRRLGAEIKSLYGQRLRPRPSGQSVYLCIVGARFKCALLPFTVLVHLVFLLLR